MKLKSTFTGQCSLADVRVYNASRFLLKISEHTWGLNTAADTGNWTNKQFHKYMEGIMYNLNLVVILETGLANFSISTGKICTIKLLNTDNGNWTNEQFHKNLKGNVKINTGNWTNEQFRKYIEVNVQFHSDTGNS